MDDRRWKRSIYHDFLGALYSSSAILENSPPHPTHILTFLVYFFWPASCCELLVIACAQKRLQRESAAWKKIPEAEVEQHFKIHCINNALDDTQDCVLWRKKVISELKSDAEYLKSECEEASVVIFFCSQSFYLCSSDTIIYHHCTYHESPFNKYKIIFVFKKSLSYSLIWQFFP